MDKTLIKTISFFVGGLSVIVAGLFFVLVSDISLLNTSTWLFFAIFTSLGSGIAVILTDYLKSKKIWLFVVSGIAFVLGVLYIVVLFKYRSQFIQTSNGFNETVYNYVKSQKKYTSVEIINTVNFVTITSVVCGLIGLLGQGSYIVMNILVKEED